MQQPTGLIPAGLGVDDAARSAPSVGGMIDLGQFVFASPAYEVAAVTPKRLSAGQPGVKIALACRGECQLLCGEPIQRRLLPRSTAASSNTCWHTSVRHANPVTAVSVTPSVSTVNTRPASSVFFHVLNAL